MIQGSDSLDLIFTNDKPIYIQLVEQLKLAIVTNVFEPGEKIPSVRDLALEYKVNPNTIQKSLMELELNGLIYTERTTGKYVTKDIELIEKEKESLAIKAITKYLTDMAQLGYSKKESIKYLEEGKK